MTSSPPRVFRSVKLAILDAIGALRERPGLFVALCVVSMLTALARSAILSREITEISTQLVAFSIADSILTGIISAPFAVCIHRRIILGDGFTSLDLASNGQIFLRFYIAIVTMAIYFALLNFSFIAILSANLGPVLWALAFALWLAGAYFAMRFGLLFPAIAVEDGAGFGAAYERSRGLVWRMFLATLLLMLPFMVAVSLSKLASKASGSYGWLIEILTAGVLQTLIVAMSVAVVSRFYLWRITADEDEKMSQAKPA